MQHKHTQSIISGYAIAFLKTLFAQVLWLCGYQCMSCHKLWLITSRTKEKEKKRKLYCRNCWMLPEIRFISYRSLSLSLVCPLARIRYFIAHKNSFQSLCNLWTQAAIFTDTIFAYSNYPNVYYQRFKRCQTSNNDFHNRFHSFYIHNKM